MSAHARNSLKAEGKLMQDFERNGLTTGEIRTWGDGIVYVLATHWSFDHSYQEYVTISLEGGENRYEDVLRQPDSDGEKRLVMSRLQELADATNRNPMADKGTLHALYRVKHGRHDREHKTLSFELEPVCWFKDGVPQFLG
jgi:hypothetical protein